MSVIDEHGKTRALFSLWENRKLVLIFTRHMGCRFCKEQVSELQKIQPKLAVHGLTVCLITIGKYKDITKFKVENGFSGEVYVDSSLFYPECYNTMKLGNGKQYLFVVDDSKIPSSDGIPGEFLSETKEASVRAAREGFIDGGYGTPDSEFTGDTLQIGGAFVLGPGNSCDYSYRCSFAGDLVDLDKVVAAATGKDAEGEEIFYSATLDWNEKLNIYALADTFEAIIPQDPVRTKQENANTSDLFTYSIVGAGVFVVFMALVLQVRTSAQIAEQKLEPVLVGAMGTVTLTILLAYALNIKIFYLPTSIRETTQPSTRSRGSTPNSASSDSAKSAEIFTGACPVVDRPLHRTALSIGGCSLYKLSSVDKIALSSAGDVHCDCTFLEEVDMINMADRYTISAPVAVNSGLFSKNHSNSPHDHSEGTTHDSEDSANFSSISPNSPSSPLHKRHQHSHLVSATSATADGTDNTCPVVGPGATTEMKEHLAGNELKAAQSIICYVREFLAKPNPNLGRSGPTCPFVPKSLQMDTIYLSVLTAEDVTTSEELESLLLEAIQTFKALQPQTGPKASYKAIILIFPDMETNEIPAMIDGTQKRLKPHFVEEGLMLGEFHLRNNATGLHNAHFYPLRTPYPCLAIRHMVPSDIAFLNPVEFPAQVRKKMISAFLAKFGDKASNDQQTEVARALLRALQ